MVKSLVAVEISHYTSDTGHPLYGLLVPYPRSGFTITAVTFIYCSTVGNRVLVCLYARCRFLDAEGLVRGDSVGEP